MATYAGRYDEPLIRKAGNRLAPPADGTTVLVYESDGSTEATLYADRTKSTTADNPVEVDASGNIEFFADPGTYVLSILEDGSEVATDTVTVFNDPAESTGGSGAVDSVNGQTGVVVLDADDIDDTSTTNRFATAAELTKLAGIEANATADMTGAEIKTAYEAEADTNAYTDAEKSKLAGIEAGATADQTAAEVSITDAGGYFTSTNVEGALQEAGADIAGLAGSGVSDGDKGDITVSGSGATWTIDNNAVTLAKLADIATSSILGRTTASTGDPEVLTAAQVRSLLNVEDGATADQTAAEILTALLTVDGTGSGLDADLLDGNEAATFATSGHNHDSAYADADGEYSVNTVAASGATETLTLAPAHRVTMDQNCTFTFPSPTAGHTFLLLLSGAFTPTFPASVDWDSATAPTYATPSLYGFTTVDGGTTWLGTLIASGLG